MELNKQYILTEISRFGISPNSDFSKNLDRFISGLEFDLSEAKSEISRLNSNNEPKYAKKGDYCAVCGCTEFWNDEEE
jgi:hypothetical protein